MSQPSSLHAQLAELFGRYVRAADGVERNQLGAQLDALAPLVTHKETPREEQPADRVAPAHRP